jgi:exopolyphosphatase/guanosine-5'-triphosphate,3'-diphosphate pyrophosphatase
MDLIVVGGTAVALAMLELKLAAFDSAAIEGLQIGVTQVTAKIDLLTRLSQSERAKLPGMELSRMDILVPGLCLLERFLHKANCSHFSVSDRGVRYGVILEWLEQRASQNRPVLP